MNMETGEVEFLIDLERNANIAFPEGNNGATNFIFSGKDGIPPPLVSLHFFATWTHRAAMFLAGQSQPTVKMSGISLTIPVTMCGKMTIPYWKVATLDSSRMMDQVKWSRNWPK